MVQIVLKEKLINKARLSEFHLRFNSFDNYQIWKILKTGEFWLLSELYFNRWLITVDRIPETIITTQTALDILDLDQFSSSIKYTEILLISKLKNNSS